MSDQSETSWEELNRLVSDTGWTGRVSPWHKQGLFWSAITQSYSWGWKLAEYDPFDDRHNILMEAVIVWQLMCIWLNHDSSLALNLCLLYLKLSQHSLNPPWRACNKEESQLYFLLQTFELLFKILAPLTPPAALNALLRPGGQKLICKYIETFSCWPQNTTSTGWEPDLI